MADPVQRINDLRQKVMAGEDISLEEAAEAVALIRADREPKLTTKADKAVKAIPIDLNDLFKPKEK